jgi:acyl-CoA synthetase (AMP-forming)/AMP-acid ligase II
VQPGDLVALFLPNSPEFIFAWAGLWALGAAPAMINYHLTGQALLHCVRISTAKLVLVDGDAVALGRMETVRPELEKLGMRVVPFGDVKAQALAMPDTRPPDSLREGLQLTFPMALFYTSGTTGLPKAAAMPTIAGFFHGIGREAGSSPFVPDTSTRYYDCMPYYHGTGGINAMACLMCGATLCIAPRFSASGFWADVRDSGATWFVYVGETVRYLLAAPPSEMDKKHNVHSIYGNGLRPDVWRRFRDRFGITKVFEMFNSTEGMLQLDNPSRGDFTINAVGHHGLLQRWKYHDSYIPVLVDTDTGDLARDERTGFAVRVPYEVGGEILVKLPFERTFAGYWRNPDATAKKYVENVFVKGDRYFRTGDALRRDADGRWFFMDR